MFINDLSPMPNIWEMSKKQMIGVGWLDCTHRFPIGPTLESFRDKLRLLCDNPIRRTRGFHVCPFCDKGDTRGNGEIEVAGADGIIYVAPSLIFHYVVMHDYQPPKEFIDAVRLCKTIGRCPRIVLQTG